MNEEATTTDPESGTEGRFSEEEVAEIERSPSPGLTEEDLRRRDRALARIVQYGDPILRSRASEVESVAPSLRDEALGMAELMRDAFGCGLAANQVGKLHRILVFQSSEEEEATALVNPVAEWLSDQTDSMTEGCLSIPGVVVDVERPIAGRFRALDVSGEELLLEVEGLEARIIQHELDHLDGILILDRAEDWQRREALGALRRGESWAPPVEDDEPEADRS